MELPDEGKDAESTLLSTMAVVIVGTNNKKRNRRSKQVIPKLEREVEEPVYIYILYIFCLYF